MSLVNADDCVLRKGELYRPNHYEQDKGPKDDVSRAPPTFFEGAKGCHYVRGAESSSSGRLWECSAHHLSWSTIAIGCPSPGSISQHYSFSRCWRIYSTGLISGPVTVG